MNPDSRIIIYGGVPIAVGVLSLGVWTGSDVLTMTGTGLSGATVAVAVGLDTVLEA